MQLNTKNFGELTYEESDIITFINPISGLSNTTKYLLISKDEDLLFFWLQSIEKPEYCLCLMDVFKVLPEYNPEVAEFQVLPICDLSKSPNVNLDEIKTYNVVVIPKNVKDMTVNLLAPIVINETTNKALQLITNNDNELSYKIFDKLGNQSTNGGNN